MTDRVSILKDYKGREIRPRARRRVAACLPGLAAFVIAACWLFAQNEKPAAGIPGPEAAGAQTALHYSPAPEAAAHIQGAAHQPERDAPAGLQHAAYPPRPAPLTDLAPAGASGPGGFEQGAARSDRSAAGAPAKLEAGAGQVRGQSGADIFPPGPRPGPAASYYVARRGSGPPQKIKARPVIKVYYRSRRIAGAGI